MRHISIARLRREANVHDVDRRRESTPSIVV